MKLRSLFAVAMTACLVSAGGVSSQVLYCPEPVELSTEKHENRMRAETLLVQLLTAMDLQGQAVIDQDAILRAHGQTPGALLAKLSNVADRCSLKAMRSRGAFHEELPELRRALLEAVLVEDTASSAGNDFDIDDMEQSINLSLRDLWRKLWFRPAPGDNEHDHRWAVIVASPEGVPKGWLKLGEHQTTWDDVYFELHQPYYNDSDYHAIVVGKKLPRNEAERLLDYVKELGMADDAYLWPLPIESGLGGDQPAGVAAPLAAPAAAPFASSSGRGPVQLFKTRDARQNLDLSILD